MSDPPPSKSSWLRPISPGDLSDWGKALALPFALYAMAFFNVLSPAYAVWMWLFGVSFAGGIAIWRTVAVPGFSDTRRAAAAVAYGVFPYALYIPLWDELNTRRAYFIAFPFLAVWGVIALVIAVREKPLPQPPLIRTISLAGSGLLYGALSVASLGAAGLFIYCIPTAAPALQIAFTALAILALGLGALLAWVARSLISSLGQAPADAATDL